MGQGALRLGLLLTAYHGKGYSLLAFRGFPSYAGGVLLAVVTIVATLLDEAFLGATGIRPGFPSLLIIVSIVSLCHRKCCHTVSL